MTKTGPTGQSVWYTWCRTKSPHLGTWWNSLPIVEAIVLGIVQGLTEFLPVSSTAHLALIPWLVTRLRLANWSDPGLTFDVALHAGTLFAILFYFWRTWIQILRAAFGGKGRPLLGTQRQRSRLSAGRAAPRTALAVVHDRGNHTRRNRRCVVGEAH